MPRPAGGTPTTVPARPWLGGPPRPGGAAGGPGGMGGPAGGAPGGRGGPAEGCWFMSMVPLNFGAAAPFRLKPHFVHVDAVSEFCVPQLGQNTHHLRRESRVPCILHASRVGAEGNGRGAWFSSRRKGRTPHAWRAGVRASRARPRAPWAWRLPRRPARRCGASGRGRARSRSDQWGRVPGVAGDEVRVRACRPPRPSYRLVSFRGSGADPLPAPGRKFAPRALTSPGVAH
jgi:hypothetical protein